MVDFIGALDQGTSSTRFIVANILGETQGYFQKAHTQSYPKPGWVEQDPITIWDNSQLVIQSVLQKPVYPGPYLGNRGSCQILNVLSVPHRPPYIQTNS